MLDPAPAMPLPEALLSRTTWLTPNETEAQILLGRVNIDPAAAAEKLLAMGVRNVALKLGSQGVFLAGRDCPAQQIPAFTVKAVDTTAAGDCFNAAFAVALTRGNRLPSPPVTRPLPQRFRSPEPALNLLPTAEVEAFCATESEPGLHLP